MDTSRVPKKPFMNLSKAVLLALAVLAVFADSAVTFCWSAANLLLIGSHFRLVGGGLRLVGGGLRLFSFEALELFVEFLEPLLQVTHFCLRSRIRGLRNGWT